MTRASRTILPLLGVAIKAVLALLVYCMPVLGFWLASSLAAYRGGATWLPLLVGLLAFPVAPLAWDALAEYRRKRRNVSRARILTFGDRLLLRTFAITFSSISLLLVTRPELAFVALSTRGDWMLDGRHTAPAEKLRRALFGAAQGLEWLYELSHENQFAALVDDQGRPDKPAPSASSSAPSTPAPLPAIAQEPGAVPVPPLPPSSPPALAWPAPAALHPVVLAMPADAEQSLEGVAAYVRDHEPDPLQRLKALHDWIADRIAYDAVALAEHDMPDQSARAVFAARKGVCAGYANLLDAMAKVTGDELVVVVGDARTDLDEVSGGGHAWNAARIAGKWQLIDVTWDAGSVSGREFTKQYRTDYLFTPPDVFVLDHLPELESWQLRDKPLTRGEFMRQPMLKASFFSRGFHLQQPERSQVTVSDELEVVLDNPAGQFVMASYWSKGEVSTQRTSCRVEPGPRILARCRFPLPGVFRVMLFANTQQLGSFEDIALFEVVRR